MNVILSNYGLRLLTNMVPPGLEAGVAREHLAPRGLALEDAELRALKLLCKDVLQPYQAGMHDALIARGLAQTAKPELDRGAVWLRYQRNPLQHIDRLTFEYTTLCNLDCCHCRNGHVRPVVEGRPDTLADAVDVVVPLGVERFDFIGGEVVLFGKGWLNLVRHIRGHAGTVAAVLTSGWFLGKRDFLAAGVRYHDDDALLAALREAGLTHLTFSLDGPEAIHDDWRGIPGLYRRVLDAFARVRGHGLVPQVSLVIHRDHPTGWIEEIADQLYDLPGATAPDKALHLLRDRMNYVSNFIDIGNGAGVEGPRCEIPDALLRCKNFFRPYPTLRIQATGEVSLCPLADGGTGFGNVHHVGLLHVLNHMQETFVHRLHAEDRLGEYRDLVDPEIFGEHVGHVCTLRTIITLLARGVEEGGVDRDDDDALRELNLEIARRTGFLPPVGTRATGVRRPM
jgi:MoaA/NifB/PqqE/SkfB family radical SAM enzyme